MWKGSGEEKIQETNRHNHARTNAAFTFVDNNLRCEVFWGATHGPGLVLHALGKAEI